MAILFYHQEYLLYRNNLPHCQKIYIRFDINWNGKVIGVLNFADCLTYVTEPLSANNCNTMIYRCKAY